MTKQITNTVDDSLQYRRNRPLWMPIYWNDYFGDTRHLTTLEHGAYLLLLAAYWQNAGPLPDDNKYLSRVTCMHPNGWVHVRKSIEGFFNITGGYWHHKRVETELLRACDRIASAKRAACVRWASALPTTTTTTEVVSKKDIAEPTVQPVSEWKGNSRKKREQGHRLPTEWRPTLRHYALGEELGIGAAGVDSAAEDMRLWAEANAHRAVARKSNWDATFTGWMKRNMNNSFTGNNGGGNGHRRPQTLKERTADALQRLGSGSFGENVDLGLPKLGPD